MQSVRSTSFDGCRSFERSTVTMSWTLSGWKPATCELRCSWVQNRADMLNVLTKFNGSVRKCVRTFSDAVCNMMRYDVIYRYDVMGAFVFFYHRFVFKKVCCSTLLYVLHWLREQSKNHSCCSQPSMKPFQL